MNPENHPPPEPKLNTAFQLGFSYLNGPVGLSQSPVWCLRARCGKKPDRVAAMTFSRCSEAGA